MKTWKDWEANRDYKYRHGNIQGCKCGGELITCIKGYDGKMRLRFAHHVSYANEYNPSDFLLCDIETVTVGVRRKSDGKVFEVDKSGDVPVIEVKPFFRMSGDRSIYWATPASFMDVISGKYKDDYELVTETKVVAEYEHESVKERACETCQYENEPVLTGPCRTCAPICISKEYRPNWTPKDKCATCAHEYEAKEEKLPDLPPLAIIPGSEDECEAVRERAKQHGGIEVMFSRQATVIAIGWRGPNMLSICSGPLARAIDFYRDEFPQARIMTGAEFLREFPGK